MSKLKRLLLYLLNVRSLSIHKFQIHMHSLFYFLHSLLLTIEITHLDVRTRIYSQSTYIYYSLRWIKLDFD